MTSETVDKAKADAKKGIADIGKKVADVKADVKADVEKAKANFGKSDLEKKAAYAKADIKADAEKAKADVENKMAHAKADTEKAKADIGRKMDDALRQTNANKTAVIRQLGGAKNGRLAIFGGSVLCYSFDTWNTGVTRCGNIDGHCQMANNRVRHPGGIIAHIWWHIPPGSITACTAWNLGFED